MAWICIVGSWLKSRAISNGFCFWVESALEVTSMALDILVRLSMVIDIPRRHSDAALARGTLNWFYRKD